MVNPVSTIPNYIIPVQSSSPVQEDFAQILLPIVESGEVLKANGSPPASPQKKEKSRKVEATEKTKHFDQRG